jgi:hypothetical protein
MDLSCCPLGGGAATSLYRPQGKQNLSEGVVIREGKTLQNLPGCGLFRMVKELIYRIKDDGDVFGPNKERTRHADRS